MGLFTVNQHYLNTTDDLKYTKKARNSTNKVLPSHTCSIKSISDDYLMKPIVSVINVNSGHLCHVTVLRSSDCSGVEKAVKII